MANVRILVTAGPKTGQVLTGPEGALANLPEGSWVRVPGQGIPTNAQGQVDPRPFQAQAQAAAGNPQDKGFFDYALPEAAHEVLGTPTADKPTNWVRVGLNVLPFGVGAAGRLASVAPAVTRTIQGVGAGVGGALGAMDNPEHPYLGAIAGAAPGLLSMATAAPTRASTLASKAKDLYQAADQLGPMPFTGDLSSTMKVAQTARTASGTTAMDKVIGLLDDTQQAIAAGGQHPTLQYMQQLWNDLMQLGAGESGALRQAFLSDLSRTPEGSVFAAAVKGMSQAGAAREGGRQATEAILKAGKYALGGAGGAAAYELLRKAR